MELWSVQCRHNINLVLRGKIVELPLGRNFVPKVLVLLIHCKNMIPKLLILVHSSDSAVTVTPTHSCYHTLELILHRGCCITPFKFRKRYECLSLTLCVLAAYHQSLEAPFWLIWHSFTSSHLEGCHLYPQRLALPEFRHPICCLVLIWNSEVDLLMMYYGIRDVAAAPDRFPPWWQT